MAKRQGLKKLENVWLNSDEVVQPIGTKFTGFVGDALRPNILKFERDRPADG